MSILSSALKLITVIAATTAVSVPAQAASTESVGANLVSISLPTPHALRPEQSAIVPAPALLQAPGATPPALGVFSSVAISAARLPAAAKWQAARRKDFSALFGNDCAAAFASGCDSQLVRTLRGVAADTAGLSERAALDLVNRRVNGAIRYRSDRAIWGSNDYWATPAEIARKGAGDCEDFAITKYWLLRSMGVSEERMQLVLLQDTRRQLFHAVLVVHTAGGAYVLDNVSNRLRQDSAYGQYHPIMSFAGSKSYIHGFASGSRSVATTPDLASVAPGMGM